MFENKKSAIESPYPYKPGIIPEDPLLHKQITDILISQDGPYEKFSKYLLIREIIEEYNKLWSENQKDFN